MIYIFKLTLWNIQFYNPYLLSRQSPSTQYQPKMTCAVRETILSEKNLETRIRKLEKAVFKKKVT